MNLKISKFNINSPQITFNSKGNVHPSFKSKEPQQPKVVSVYGDSPIRTNPAQLSLFALHDFHGQDIRMERAYTASKYFDDETLYDKDKIFDSNLPVDKLKLASGDMFLGENLKELDVINEFLNLTGVLANVMGNHECDAKVADFAAVVRDREYKFLAANMHPVEHSIMNSLLSKSFIVESNGNKYGIIGLAPSDMAAHMKRPEEVEEFKISDVENTIKDLKKEVEILKNQGVNKIVVLSHLGFENEKKLAQNVSDVDVILGAHTHNLLTEVKVGENLVTSPKGEPVLITQFGRDGEYIGIPNLVFNELGQITKIQYNIARTEDFERSLVAKQAFEKILGKPDVVGFAQSVQEPPKDIYANENPHCNFILDCMKEELGTDIAIMNSANIRGKFHKGNIDTRDLALISPFANKVTVIRASEEELVESFENIIEKSMDSPVHRPGIFQVSGLRYEYSQKEGELVSMTFIDKNGKEIPIDIDNPREDKFYTIATDDYCACSSKSGLNLKHRFKEALANFDYDKDKVVEQYLRNHPESIEIKTDGRIKIVED